MRRPNNRHWLEKVLELLCADTHDLRELANRAGGDPSVFYKGAKTDGMDLRGQDLRGIEFSDLDICRVLIDEHTILDARRQYPMRKRFPRAIDPKRVGRYSALAKSGAGYVWDEVLEYRVWCHPHAGAPDEDDGSDYYHAFSNYPDALRFSQITKGAEEPLALVLQREHINEPEPGKYVHVKRRRVTEWQVEWLSRPKRGRNTIRDFLSRSSPPNRLDTLRGISPRRKRPR